MAAIWLTNVNDPLSRVSTYQIRLRRKVLTGLTHLRSSTTFADYSWSYDAGNRLTQFTSLADGTAAYSYDATLQLTGADYSYQTDEAYAYDRSHL